MIRRTAIGVFVLIAWSASGSWSVVRAQRSGPAARPNVLFITADDLNPIGNPGGPGPVHHPDALPAAPQSLQGGQADGAGSEDDVPWCVVVHDCSLIIWWPGWTVVWPATSRLGGSSRSRRIPERAEKVTAPVDPKIENCCSTAIPTSAS